MRAVVQRVITNSVSMQPYTWEFLRMKKNRIHEFQKAFPMSANKEFSNFDDFMKAVSTASGIIYVNDDEFAAWLSRLIEWLEQ